LLKTFSMPSVGHIVSVTATYYHNMIFSISEKLKAEPKADIFVPSIAIRSHGSSGRNSVFSGLRSLWSSLGYLIIELDPWQKEDDVKEDILKKNIYTKVCNNKRTFGWILLRAWTRHMLVHWGPKLLIIILLAFLLYKFMFLNDYTHPNITKNIARGTSLMIIFAIATKIFGGIADKLVSNFLYKSHGEVSIFTWKDIKKCSLKALKSGKPLVVMLRHMDHCTSTEIVALLKEIYKLTTMGIIVVALFEYKVVALALETEFKTFNVQNVEFTEDYLVPGYSEMSTYCNVNICRPLYTAEMISLDNHFAEIQEFDYIADEKIETITHELIQVSARHLRLSQKAIDGYYTTIKLYAAILNITSTEDLLQLSAALFVERYDPLWFDYFYHKRLAENTVFGRIPVINNLLKQLLANDEKVGKFWYQLTGRSFLDSIYATKNES